MPTRDHSRTDVDRLVLLWTARRSGVIDALVSSAGTPEAVASETGVTERTARLLVTALADMGFLQRVGDEYEITNRALGFLAKRDVRSIGRLPHALDRLDRWADLPERLGSDAPPTPTPAWTRNRLGAHAATDDAVVRACVTEAVHARPEATRVVDVAGASGVYAVEFAGRGYDVTLVEARDVLDVVEPSLAHTAVTLERGSPAALPDGVDGADLVFAVDLARRVSPADFRTFLADAFDRLAAGGALVLVDAVRGRSEASVAAAADALVDGAGDVYDEPTYRARFDAAGFDRTTVRDVPGTTSQSVTGHKRTVD